MQELFARNRQVAGCDIKLKKALDISCLADVRWTSGLPCNRCASEDLAEVDASHLASFKWFRQSSCCAVVHTQKRTLLTKFRTNLVSGHISLWSTLYIGQLASGSNCRPIMLRQSMAHADRKPEPMAAISMNGYIAPRSSLILEPSRTASENAMSF